MMHLYGIKAMCLTTNVQCTILNYHFSSPINFVSSFNAIHIEYITFVRQIFLKSTEQ